MKTEQKSAQSPPKKAAKKAAARPLPRADEAGGGSGKSASQLISTRIAELGDWRGDVLRHVRELIKEADPGITEEWKWSNPVWSHNGIVCTGESYKKVVKLTFAKGASLRDPATLFNSSLDGNVRRAIDIHEGDEMNESAFKDLIRAAVEAAKDACARQTGESREPGFWLGYGNAFMACMQTQGRLRVSDPL